MPKILRDRDDIHIALLRGVNIGGKKKVPMEELRALARRLGFGGPRTLLNSGNLVYAADGRPAHEAALALELGIAQQMKVSTTVIVITAVELDAIIEENALAEDEGDPSRLLVSIWREPHDRAALLPLLEHDWAEERFHLGSRAAYQQTQSNVLESDLISAVADTLDDRVTARNWTTIQKLSELADDVVALANGRDDA